MTDITLEDLATTNARKGHGKPQKLSDEYVDPEGQALAQKCLEKYRTARALSHLIGISSSAISTWARGEKPVRRPYAMAMRVLLQENSQFHPADQVAAIVTISKEKAQVLEKAVVASGGTFHRLTFKASNIQVGD